MGFAALNPSYDAALLDRLGHGKTEIRLDKTLEALLGGRLAFLRETGILRALVVVCTIAPLPERVQQIFLGLHAQPEAVLRPDRFLRPRSGARLSRRLPPHVLPPLRL